MSFVHPEVLLLLIPAGALLRRRPVSLPVTGAPWRWMARRPSWKVRSAAHLPRVAVALGSAALILAGAGPVQDRPGSLPPEAAVGVMVVLDVSASMREGEDPALPRAVSALERWVSTADGFRTGLVTFAGSALTRLPPTTDTALLTEALRTASAGLDDQGSALGAALGLAVERLQSSPVQARTVILLTDGLSNAGSVDPFTAASLASEAEIQVHALLLGETPAAGRELLARITGSTGGRAVAAGSDARLLEAIRELVPRSPPRGPPVDEPVALPFLLAGVLCLGVGEAVRGWKPMVGA